jgi:hypothetical protein
MIKGVKLTSLIRNFFPNRITAMQARCSFRHGPVQASGSNTHENSNPFDESHLVLYLTEEE